LMLLFTVLSATLVLCLPAAIIFSAGGMYLVVEASALFASAYRVGVVAGIES
jgi:hypothetical protein